MSVYDLRLGTMHLISHVLVIKSNIYVGAALIQRLVPTIKMCQQFKYLAFFRSKNMWSLIISRELVIDLRIGIDIWYTVVNMSCRDDVMVDVYLPWRLSEFLKFPTSFSHFLFSHEGGCYHYWFIITVIVFSSYFAGCICRQG